MSSSLPPEIIDTIKRALAEDIGTGDVTTNSIVPEGALLSGQISAKQNGVVAGLEVARQTFRCLNHEISFHANIIDGEEVSTGTELVRLTGPARALLTGERTALNFLGRMSGIATLTKQFVRAVAGTKAKILDTRKTAPGLRLTDKLAVSMGGGQNHRAGLFDMVLIKDNHIDFAGSITAAVERVRATRTKLLIEVEARTLKDVTEALSLNVDRILLDNMSLEMMREGVAMSNGRTELEASGNITFENVTAVAQTGVDYISVGALTHSPRVFDVSLSWIS